jgi:hypothetical protein
MMNKKIIKIEYKRLLSDAIIFLITMIAVSAIIFNSSPSAAPVAASLQARGQDKAFSGGTFEASGVAQVPGSNGFLFVDDGRTGEIFYMEVDPQGNQLGSIKAVKLGVTIEDPEGISTDGSHFYIVGSQSKGKGAEQVGIIRFKFDPKSLSVAEVETISELKKFLVENVAELRQMGAKKGTKDGINIEGLAWDGQGERLLLGLRSPVVDGHALVVALKLNEPRGPFSYGNIKAAETRVLKLQLGGLGIRSLEYDSRLQAFRIIAGATENQAKTDFRLWEWKEADGQTQLREVTTFDRKLKPEGITGATVGEQSYIFVVFDTSRYLRMD